MRRLSIKMLIVISHLKLNPEFDLFVSINSINYLIIDFYFDPSYNFKGNQIYSAVFQIYHPSFFLTFQSNSFFKVDYMDLYLSL